MASDSLRHGPQFPSSLGLRFAAAPIAVSACRQRLFVSCDHKPQILAGQPWVFSESRLSLAGALL
jgi:hypothetical protein